MNGAIDSDVEHERTLFCHREKIELEDLAGLLNHQRSRPDTLREMRDAHRPTGKCRRSAVDDLVSDLDHSVALVVHNGDDDRDSFHRGGRDVSETHREATVAAD